MYWCVRPCRQEHCVRLYSAVSATAYCILCSDLTSYTILQLGDIPSCSAQCVCWQAILAASSALSHGVLQNIKPKSAKHARALALVAGCAASIVAVVEYLTEKKAGELYDQETLNHPGSPEEALATWIRQLLLSLCPGVANDLCHAAINKLCSLMSCTGQLGKASIAK